MAAVAPPIGEGFVYHPVSIISSEVNRNISIDDENESTAKIEKIHNNVMANVDNVLAIVTKDDNFSDLVTKAHETNEISNQIVSENIITTNDENSKEINPEKVILDKIQLTERQIQQQEQLRHHLNLAKVGAN
jgi:hypothetical protein